MTPECEDEEFKAVPNELGAPQGNECCDTETIRRIPDELREPDGGVPTEPQPLPQPGPVTIGNKPVTVYCEGDYIYGDPVSLPADYRTQNLYFSSVLSITDNVLNYITTHNLEDTITARFRTGTLTAEELRTLTGMTVVQAREFLELAQGIQDNLTSLVREIALSQLDCYWKNFEQMAECPDPLMAHETESPEAVFRAVVPAGQYTSKYSQEDADQKAKDAAESMLNCFYMNDPFTARCHERPNRPDEATEPVPNDMSPIYPGRSLRVGTVEVPANKFKSILSKEDANQKAQDWGYSQLVCWYPNLEIHANCDDPRARNIGVDPNIEPQATADLEKRTYGQIVDIPYGYFTSELSVEVATQEAEQLAESLLQCCFINNPITLKCESEEVIMEDGTKAMVEPAPAPISPMPEVHVPAGTYTSCVSQEEADELAALSVEGMLQCAYCNLPVMPTCVPYWVLDGVKAPADDPEHIDLPLTEGNIGNSTHEYVSAASFPTNATRGYAAGGICATSAQDAQQMAEMLGKLPITGSESSSDESCTYYNDLIIVACASNDPYTGADGTSGHWGVIPDTGEPYYFYSMYSAGACLYEDMTSPKPGEYIMANAGMFSDQGADKKDELNERAINWAMSMLQCWFTNPDIQAACYGFTTRHSSLCETSWTLSVREVDPSAEHDPRSYLTSWSNTPERPVTIPEGQILVQGGSEAEAFASIMEEGIALARAQVLCMFGNYATSDSTCINTNTYQGSLGGGGYICARKVTENKVYKSVNIDRMTFIGDSVDAATEAALRIVQHAAFCYTDDYIIYYECSGGMSSDTSSSDPHSPGFPPDSSEPESSSQLPESFPEGCTLEVFATYRSVGSNKYDIENLHVNLGFGDGRPIPESEYEVEGGGPWGECEQPTITVRIPGTTCSGSTTLELPCHSSASSNLSSTGQENCYYNCPNFQGQKPIALDLGFSITKEDVENVQAEFMLWENDAAANYERLSYELSQLERQIQILEAQL